MLCGMRVGQLWWSSGGSASTQGVQGVPPHLRTCVAPLLPQVTKDGVSISEPFALDVKWDYKMFSQPTKWAVGAW